MIKKLMPYLSKYGIYAVLCPLAIIGEVLLEIRIPFLMAKIVDNGIPSKDIAYVMQTGGLMVVMALLSLLFGVLGSKFGATAGMGFGSELRKGLFNKIQEFSFSNIDKFSTASLVTRLTTDVNNAQNAFMMMIRVLVRAPVMLVSATIMAYTINKSLVKVFLAAIPVLSAALIVIAGLAFPRFSKLLKKYDALNASVQENLIAIRVVKAFVRSGYEKLKFKAANDELMNAAMRAEKVVVCNMPIMQITIYFCIAAILWFGGNMIIAGTMLTGQLISFISYVTQIMVSLMMISMVLITVVLSRASVSRILEVLDEKADIADKHIKGGQTVKDGSIDFEDVSFRYDPQAESDTLEHVDIHIKSGQTIGIIGGTGSSKTTLVQLIPRLYDVTGGRVLVGGVDVRDYNLKELRDSVAMVLQKNVLFSGTIKDNLKWGNKNATDEQIIAACKAAQAHDFIESFPDGYETELGQGGVNVSGGQKQRLCIARALLKEPKILILDDSTSAVDTATDLKIREALRNYSEEITAVIIAQRISSVCDADKIIVLDDGKLDAVGSHKELLQNNRIYQEVYYSQQEGVGA
ncbi:ATP-binding cassette subfamily B protein [Ruminiclostridium sufflavum DSM 19573]|uniref:ATP-binding cassette subfamily B protein n=1 Tax=Ruminiclostridium sufflavum DSM 19573 TaxID=1121337 RepID=A0A318XJK6_9FIRM|nr:ABC transporter ATP-binding protein [Ruminiclostridium sufflavum]PYG87404.1 ATP-binding cassette subfamily B protein [Ruminiclostridium sufflavum DSM 19573]